MQVSETARESFTEKKKKNRQRKVGQTSVTGMANGVAYKAFKTERQSSLPYEIKKKIIANSVAVKNPNGMSNSVLVGNFK